MFSGLISCGDEVIEVNGINVEGKSPNDVLRILVIILAFKNDIDGVSKMLKFLLPEYLNA
jgi:hypothetical protein